MKTLDFLTGDMGEMLWPAVAAGVAIALLGAALSVPVVLKRLAFIGQGVSHAAFGGAGIALVLGLVGTSAAMSLAYLGVVGIFCVMTAIAIAWASSRGSKQGGTAGAGAESAAAEDTVIGVFLVGTMALGALLTHWQRNRAAGSAVPGAEQILFGSILDVGWADAAIAWAVLAITLITLVSQRRALIFWLFDEPAAEAFGVRVTPMRYLLLAMLGVATVTAMKLAGAVLATAVLVIPGAAALRLSDRLGTVVLLAGAVGLIGMVGGMVVSFEMDWPPGACVVLVLAAQHLAASIWNRLSRA